MKFARQKPVSLVRTVRSLLVLAVALTSFPLQAQESAQPSQQPATKPQSVTVNGVNLVYETYGPEGGKPIIVLHGNGSSHKKMEPVSQVLAKAGYRVYALDSRGQGGNKPEKEYHYADMADDVFFFIHLLKIDHPAVYGHSDGGIIALLLEINHPGSTSLLAASGVNVRPDGVNKKTLNKWKKLQAENPTPLREMLLKEPHITSSQLGTISVPTLITGGSEDVIKTQHLTFIAASIKDSELVIFDGENHSSYVYNNGKMTDALIFYMAEKGYR